MKIKMYGGNRPLTEKAKRYNKIVDVLFAIMIGVFYAMFVMLAVVMILEIQFVFGSILCIVVPPMIFFIIWRYMNGMNMSYLELKDSTVTVVDYHIFSKNKRSINVNDIGFVKIMDAFSGKAPGRRIPSTPGMRGFFSTSYEYAVFYDKNGEYIFKYFIQFGEDYAWLEQVKNARKEKLEIM